MTSSSSRTDKPLADVPRDGGVNTTIALLGLAVLAIVTLAGMGVVVFAGRRPDHA